MTSLIIDEGKPLIDQKRPSTFFSKCIFIIFQELGERFAQYGFQSSLVLFFMIELDLSQSVSSSHLNVWSGFCLAFSILGGIWADTISGRYWTIIIFSTIYIIGLFVSVTMTLSGQGKDLRQQVFFMGLYLVALGTGGIKSNVNTFGADQFDVSIEQDRIEKESFFNWFYFAINIGAFISLTGIAYICQNMHDFFLGQFICLIGLVFATGIFLSGTKRQQRKTCNGSALLEVFGVLKSALWTNRNASQEQLDKLNVKGKGVLDRARVNYSEEQVNSCKCIVRFIPQCCMLAVQWSVQSQMNTGFYVQGCQMDAKLSNSFTLPIAALNLFDTLIIILGIPIVDKIVYPYFKKRGINRIDTSIKTSLDNMDQETKADIVRQIQNQFSFNFDRESGENENPQQDEELFKNFSEKYLSVLGVNQIGKSEYKSVLNQFKFHKDYEDSGASKGISSLQKIGVGQVFATLSMFCALLVEVARRNAPIIGEGEGVSNCGNLPVSDISIFQLIGPYMLIGISEIFTSITALEFFQSQAPESMKSVCQSLNLFSMACGFWLGAALIEFCTQINWQANNLNNGHVEFQQLFIACLMIIVFVIHILMSRKFIYNK